MHWEPRQLHPAQFAPEQHFARLALRALLAPLACPSTRPHVVMSSPFQSFEFVRSLGNRSRRRSPGRRRGQAATRARRGQAPRGGREGAHEFLPDARR